MPIPVCRDGGYQAADVLAPVAAPRGMARLHTLAPVDHRGAAGKSPTHERPLPVRSAAVGASGVDAELAACINLVSQRLLDKPSDRAVPSRAAGAQRGVDAQYTGTAAVVTEACPLVTTALAVSLAGENASHYASAARVTFDLVTRLRAGALPPPRLLSNVRVSDLRDEDPNDVHVQRPGQRHEAAAAIPQVDPQGRPVYWIGPAAAPHDDVGPGSDFRATAEDCVSVTPLQTDLTAYERMEALAQWLGK